MEHCREGKGDFILRIRNRAFDIYEIERKTKIKLTDELKQLDMECWFISSEKEFVPIRICALRKPKNTHECAETDTEFMNNYIVVVTSLLDREKISAKTFLTRTDCAGKWMYFKRLKSLLGFGDIPTKTDGNIESG